MQRYFLEQINGIITGDDAKHIVKVMRMKSNDEIITCSKGECYLSKLTILQESTVNYEVTKRLENIDFPEITLFQGMPKYAKVDTVIKYATIFGASKIIFTQMQRSVKLKVKFQD